jgi:hypothetical protein
MEGGGHLRHFRRPRHLQKISDATGAWSHTFKLGHLGSYYFKARFAGDSEWLASSSVSKRVYVR